MNTGILAPRFTRTPHLVDLVAETERLAALVASSPKDRRRTLRTKLLGEAVVATLQLDGSSITEPPDEESLPTGAAPVASAEATGREEQRRGTWIDAMRGHIDPDEAGEELDRELHLLEYLAARAGLESDDLTEHLLTDPLDGLATLHRRLTRGLLDHDHAGVPRTTDQAVHDTSVGRVIYHPAAPAQIPSRLAVLAGWLTSAAAREHGLVVSGIVHHELLSIHPYEAANGRLARTVARLLLRERSLDPDALAAVELPLAQDPLGYQEEVAKTVRRRDLTIWLERWGEAVAGALRQSARRLGLLPNVPGERAQRFLEGLDGDSFTVVDYRAGAGVGPEDSRADLRDLLDTGLVARVPGSRGLRYVRLA